MEILEYNAPELGWRAIAGGLFCSSIGGSSSDGDFESLVTQNDGASWDSGW